MNYKMLFVLKTTKNKHILTKNNIIYTQNSIEKMIMNCKNNALIKNKQHTCANSLSYFDLYLGKS